MAVKGSLTTLVNTGANELEFQLRHPLNRENTSGWGQEKKIAISAVHVVFHKIHRDLT